MRRSMTSRRFSGLFVLGLLLALGACSSGGAKDEEPQAKAADEARDHILVFDAGVSREVPLSGEATEAIVEYLAASIEKSEMVLRMAPVTESMDEIKAAARGIEVELARPRELRSGNTGQVMAPTRLLVPLTGKYGAEETSDRIMIFHGAPDYSPLPIYVKTGRDSLDRLLASHGVE